MIRTTMNLNNYAGKLAKMNLFIFVLINFEKKQIKEDIVFVMKTKTHI